MDPPYTPFDDLPEKLRKEMQLLQQYKDIANAQAAQVVDVAMSEWRKADKQVAALTAEQAREKRRAEDRAAYSASACKRKENPGAANSRAISRDSSVAEDSRR